MARAPYADIPGHKKFDADLRELIAMAGRLAARAATKAEGAKSEKERAAFEAIVAKLDQMAVDAKGVRMMLWDGTG